MNKVCTLLLILIASPLSAQRDTITLRDGTVLRKIKVLDWTAKEIKFQSRSGKDTRSAHLVESATIERVQEALGRAGNDPEVLVGEAEAQKKDALVASSCLYAAAMIYYDSHKDSLMLRALQKIDDDFPNSPYAPEYYSRKIVYYLGLPKPRMKDAAKVAQKYSDTSRTRTWSSAYALHAEYWERRIEGFAKKVQPKTFISNMQAIIGKSSSNAPFVAHAAAAALADEYRNQKKYEEAKEEYTKLQKLKGLSAEVRARMYLGLGYLSFEDALKSNRKSDYHEAFKNFLRVYLNAKKANANLVAEGLYNAAKACELWGELPTCREMAGRLRGRLKHRDPYRFTKWANKK